MLPKQVRVNPDTIYRSETPIRQKKFPNRRRTVRLSGANTPAPVRQQSTLTQQPHWIVARSSPTSEPGEQDEDEVDDHEDDDYDEDELERLRPRRKKRKSEGDGKRQTTMTQYVPSSFSAEQEVDPFHQVAAIESFDGVRDSQSHPHQTPQSRPSRAPHAEWLDEEAEEHGPQDNVMEDERGENGRTRRASSEHGEDRIDSAFAKPQAPLQQSPAMHLRTPRRIFKSEIPSSNTPQSAILSICTAKSMRSPERSPLRAKSTNLRSQRCSPDDTRMSPVPESPTKPISPFRLSPLKSRPIFRIPDKPPTFQHRSTIPDSEDTATQVTPLKQNKFRSQIPDTQMDMFGEEIPPITETQLPIENYTQYAGCTYYAENDDYNYGFDPVCSALDRDAARFMQTQLHRDRIGYDAFHKERSFSQVEEERKEPERTVRDTNRPETTIQQSQELGDDLPVQSTHANQHRHEREDYEDPPTQSPRSSPQRHLQLPYVSDDIEELDLTGDIVLPKPSVVEVIRIASSPTSKSVSSGKYPSSPPLVVENDARMQAEAEEQQIDTAQHSSPPLPITLPISPSQVSTVGGTQFFPSLKKHNQAVQYMTSSPIPAPPETSSPPPEARQHLRRFLDMYDSEDEDEGEGEPQQLPQEDDEDDDVDLDFVPRFQHDKDCRMESDDEGSERGGDHSRLRDILPDTLLDFSLPPPPTQSSVRSARS